MNSLLQYYKSVKFFLKDIKKPFSKLVNDLKDRWFISKKVYDLKSTLIMDLENTRIDLISKLDNPKSFMMSLKNYKHEFRTKKMENSVSLVDLKLYTIPKSIESLNTRDLTKSKIDEIYQEYYGELDNKLYKVIRKIKNKTFPDFVDFVEYDEESKIDKYEYKKQKIELQIEMVKLQEWAVKNGKKIAIVFEGRDAAGKGSSIKRFTEWLNPKHFRVVALGIPTKEESENWFERYEQHLPNKGEIVFFDRSWYNRAVIEPTMGYCKKKQYEDFMGKVNTWEKELIENEDIILFKFWFSIKQDKQIERFNLRKESPLKYWKFSPNDKKTINKWDVITKYKEQMFNNTSTDVSPWVVIKSNDKRISRLNSMRYILSKFDYDNKDNGTPSPNEEYVKIAQ
jgi:polyphosphate kinase 2